MKMMLLLPAIALAALIAACPAGEAGEAQAEVLRQVQVGSDLLKQDKLEAAGRVFLVALREHPDEWLPALGLMRVAGKYLERGDQEEGLSWINRTVETSKNKGELHLLAAGLHIRNKNEDEALRHVRAAVNERPDSPPVRGAALTCYANLQLFDDESREVAEKLIELQEKSVDGNLFLGLWYQYNKENDKARKHFLRSVFLDTNNIQSRLALGKFYEDTKDYKRAEREYIKMTKIAPAHFIGYFCLAELYEKTGDIDRAKEYADEAARLREAMARHESSLEGTAAQTAAPQ